MQMPDPGATTQQGSPLSLFSTRMTVEQLVALLKLSQWRWWRWWCVSLRLSACLCVCCVYCLANPSSCSLIDYRHNLSGLSSPSCLHKRRKVIGGILLCKLRTTAKFIVILTMIQESLDHPGSTHIIVCDDTDSLY